MIFKKGNQWNRCQYCGKFIGYKDFDDDKVITDFTPDTIYTAEKIEHYHLRCAKKLKEVLK